MDILTDKRQSLSIIIPVYNEEKTVIELLDKVIAAKLKVNKELIIVNDGSTDSSETIIKNWMDRIEVSSECNILFFNKENGGKGSAVRYGIERSSGDIVIIQDADLEYNPEEISLCAQPIIEGRAKIVYGSRELTKKKREYSYLSFFMGGLVVTNWVNFLFGTGLTDEPTCYKTFDGSLIRKLLFKGDGFEWEPEITCKLIRLGFEIKEVGITYSPRKLEEGKKINAVDGLKALWVILFWRFASIHKEKAKLQSLPDSYNIFRKINLKPLLLIVLIVAVLSRLLVTVPEISKPAENFSRPDTSSYLTPAYILSQTGNYSDNIDTLKAYAYRTPGYPVYMSIFYKFSDNLIPPIIIMCLISALTCIPIFYAGFYFGGKWTALIAGLLFALNITSIAHSPLLLSDTLFTFVIAIQFWYFIKFYFTKRPLFLFISVFLASIATYIRPTEILWIIPCIFLALIYKHICIQKKIIIALCLVVLFIAPLLPWVTRNYVNDSGLNLSTDTGNLLYNNGAVLLGKIEK